MEITWLLLLVLSIDGDGSGHIVTERFAEYSARESCVQAAQSFAEPAYKSNSSHVDTVVYCVPLRKLKEDSQ